MLRGSAFVYSYAKGFENACGEVPTVNGTVNTRRTELSDFGTTIGGPILHDRVFYFAAIDPQWERRTLAAPATFPLASLGGVGPDPREINAAAKAPSPLWPSNRVEPAVFRASRHGAHAPPRTDPPPQPTASGVPFP